MKFKPFFIVSVLFFTCLIVMPEVRASQTPFGIEQKFDSNGPEFPLKNQKYYYTGMAKFYDLAMLKAWIKLDESKYEALEQSLDKLNDKVINDALEVGLTEEKAYEQGYATCVLMTEAVITNYAKDNKLLKPAGFYVLEDSKRRGFVIIINKEETAEISFAVWEKAYPSATLGRANAIAPFQENNNKFATTEIRVIKNSDDDNSFTRVRHNAAQVSFELVDGKLHLHAGPAFITTPIMNNSLDKEFVHSKMSPTGIYTELVLAD